MPVPVIAHYSRFFSGSILFFPAGIATTGKQDSGTGQK